MDSLVERLHTVARGDHDRHCQGREYHCSCGFDESAWEAAEEAATVIAEALSAKDAQLAGYRHAIDRDRYIVAAVLQEIRKAVKGRRWVLESRGSYEWDDDRYREEFSDWVDTVEAASENLAKLAWDKSYSETNPALVDAARQAAKAFLIEKTVKDRVALPSDMGLPCPTCNQMPEYARPAELAELRAEIEALRGECGWIVGNGDGTAWRYWVDGMPNWTPYIDEATRFVRRCDAEEVHAEDEGAWRVVRFANARAALGSAEG